MNLVSHNRKLFICDLNFSMFDEPVKATYPSMPHDWALIDPEEYVDWHLNFGCNSILCHAYVFTGYALYPTKLGPVAPGKGSELLPGIFEATRKKGVEFWSYFNIAVDILTCSVKKDWLIPGTNKKDDFPKLAPESPWTDLLCERIREFLKDYPAEVILFDWFFYGSPGHEFKVKPAWFVEKPFYEIIGRKMPENADDITDEENLKYKRVVLEKQFEKIKQAVIETSPNTKLAFNVPYMRANDVMWNNHKMLRDSDILFSESTNEDVVDWLLDIKSTNQKVMTTIIGWQDNCDPNSWEKWHKKGCDFFGYAFGTPPDFRPHASNRTQLEIVRDAFKKII